MTCIIERDEVCCELVIPFGFTSPKRAPSLAPIFLSVERPMDRDR
jgi:hypothetical protein